MAAAGNASTSIDTRGRYKTEAQAAEAVEMLLSAGADINARDNTGQTALHGAASWGWNEVVKTLATHHAELLAKDARGRTAADIAMGSASSSGRGSSDPHPATVALLRQLVAGEAANPPNT
jgi:ankyrin repeat protein